MILVQGRKIEGKKSLTTQENAPVGDSARFLAERECPFFEDKLEVANPPPMLSGPKEELPPNDCDKKKRR
jgi:hypothetical protein